jgi:prepilin-type N-terminal cleavage/methylation domain-containing protein
MAWKTLPMISAVKTTDLRRGFTLIELVVVLAIAAAVLGGAVGLMVYSSDEHSLRRASGEIELLAKRARVTSMMRQTPYALEFRADRVRMLPLAEAGNPLRKSKKREVELQSDESATREQFLFKDGMSVFVRRWDSSEWLDTVKEDIHVWRFDPEGLCEPLSVKLALDQSWSADTFEPLTASIRASEIEAR